MTIASKSIYIDHDVMEIIQEFETNAKFRDIDLKIIDLESNGVPNQVKKIKHALANNVLEKTEQPVLN